MGPYPVEFGAEWWGPPLRISTYPRAQIAGPIRGIDKQLPNDFGRSFYVNVVEAACLGSYG
jgi:hypothetical protein